MINNFGKRVTIENVCSKLVHGGTPSTIVKNYWSGNIPWITGADFENQSISQIRKYITKEAVRNSATNIVKQNNILIVSRTGVGKIAIAPFDVAISQDITGIYFNEDVNNGFMFYCLQSHMDKFKKLNQGTSINGILKEDLLAFDIIIPSYKEQRKIAKILTTVDNLIEKTETLIAKYQSIKQGMMHDLFTRGVDANGQLRPPVDEATELYKESELGWIPREWQLCKFSNLYLIPSRNGLYKTSNFYGYGQPMVHMPQMFRDLIVNTSNAVRVSVDSKELNRFGLAEGDLLFARRSLTLEGAGQCSVIKKLQEATTFESSIIRVRLDTNSAYPFYINQFFNTDMGFKIRLPLIRQVAVSGVSSEDIASMRIPCPQVEEQKEIMHILKSIDSLIDSEKSNFNKISRIKKALMQDLLTGKVRVKPDKPEDTKS